jgi:hypothetical protein
VSCHPDDRAVVTAEQAAALLDKLRAILAVDDDGPEGSMGPRWVLGQIREVLAEPYGLHVWESHERAGWGVCSRCGHMRNYDREVIQCRGRKAGG